MLLVYKNINCATKLTKSQNDNESESANGDLIFFFAFVQFIALIKSIYF